jgi:hypothetical protein
MSFAARLSSGGVSASFKLTPGFLAGTPEYYGYNTPIAFFPFGSVSPEPASISFPSCSVSAMYHRNPGDFGSTFFVITSNVLPASISFVDVFLNGVFDSTLTRISFASNAFGVTRANPFTIGVPVDIQLFFR